MAILCNGLDVPLSITFKVGNTEQTIKSFSPDLSGTRGKIKILEECSLEIGMSLDEGAEGSGNSFLELEVQDSQETITIRAGENVNIFSHDGIFPFRMGYTTIRLVYNGHYFTNVIQVCPIHLDEKQVRGIHNYLEEKYRGIAYDLMQRKRGINSPKIQFNKWYHDYARYHLKHKNEIITLLEKVKLEKLYYLEKTYVNKPFDRRTNAKGIKLNITKPFSQSGEVSSYSKVYKMLIDSNLCICIKHLMTNWQSMIETTLKMINEEICSVLRGIDNLRSESAWARDKLGKLAYNVSPVYLNYIKSKIWVNDKKIKVLEDYNLLYDNWYKTLMLIKRHISRLLGEPEFSQIRATPKKIYYRVNDRSLRRLFQIYTNSKYDSRNTGDNRNPNPIVKPTWQVYEYFVAFKVVELIMEMGFLPADDFQADFEKSIYQGIPNGQSFTLVNADYVIKVVFNEEIPRNRYDAENFNKYFYTMNKNAPDLRVEFYTKDSSSGLEVFQGMLVIDAKHKSFSGLYSNRYNTKDMEQLDSYYRIKYRETQGKANNRQVVDRVMCVYSGGGSKFVKNYEDSITYVCVFPEAAENGDITVKGEDELAQEFYEWYESKIQAI